jgi:hypothetical protein
MDAPIGPMPYWITRIFFFTISPADIPGAVHTAYFDQKRNLYLNGIRGFIQRPTQRGGPLTILVCGNWHGMNGVQSTSRQDRHASILLPGCGTRLIMEPLPAQSAGGTSYARKKINRCRDQSSSSQVARLENCQR